MSEDKRRENPKKKKSAEGSADIRSFFAIGSKSEFCKEVKKKKEEERSNLPVISVPKIEVPFSLKVPSLTRLFLSKSKEFSENLSKELDKKRVQTIVNSVLAKYLAPLFAKIKDCSATVWENFTEVDDLFDQNDARIIETMQGLLKKIAISPIDLQTQYAFTSTKETLFHKYSHEIKQWIDRNRTKRVTVGNKKHAASGQALVLFGSNNIDKRLLCSLPIIFDVGTSILEQYFQKIETGQSYSLQLTAEDTSKSQTLSQDSKNGFQVRAGESLAFIDDIEAVSIACGNLGLYKQVADFIKTAKCPVIVSCKAIPAGLCKYADLLEFMHVSVDNSEVLWMTLYMSIAYALESSGIVEELSEMINIRSSLRKIADHWQKRLGGIKNGGFIEVVKDWIKMERYDINKVFQRIYAKLYGINEEKQEKKVNEEALDIESVGLYLDYESLANVTHRAENTSAFRTGINKIAKGFIYLLPIQRAYQSEFPSIIELLKAKVENGKRKRLNKRQCATKDPNELTFKDLSMPLINLPLGKLAMFVEAFTIGSEYNVEKLKEFTENYGALYIRRDIPMEAFIPPW